MYSLHYSSCFLGDNPDSGNLAIAIKDAEISASQKQNLAKHLNAPVTAFITSNNTPVIEFFYPNKKATFCVHGALAAAAVILDGTAEKNLSIQINFKQYLITKNENFYFITLKTCKIATPEALRDQLIDALSLQPSHLADELKPSIASVGSAKILLPFKNRDFLYRFDPATLKILNLDALYQTNGIYAYSIINGCCYARNFNPASGYFEDEATGIAAGALSAALKRNLTIYQGKDASKPSLIYTKYQDSEVVVGGKIITKTLGVSDFI